MKDSKHTPGSSQLFTRRLASLAIATLLIWPGAPGLFAQSDDFNDGNDSTPVFWNHYSLLGPWAAVYTTPEDGNGGKAYGIYAPPTSPDPYGLKNARAGSLCMNSTFTSRFSIGVDLLSWGTAGEPNIGLMWYIHEPGLGTTDGYLGTYSPKYRNLYITIATNEAQEAYFARLQDGAIVLDSTDRVRLTASSHNGYTFVFSMFNLLEPNTPWGSAIGEEYSYINTGTNHGLIVMQVDYPSTNGASAVFDNYNATSPAAGTMPAMVTDVYPLPAGKCRTLFVTNSVTILDRDTSVDDTSIMLSLDGQWLPNANLQIVDGIVRSVNPSGYLNFFPGATVTYPVTKALTIGSKHTNTVVFSDSVKWYTNTWTWTIDCDMYASNSLPAGSLNVRGFDFRMAQTTNGGVNLENSLARARQQIDGTIAVDQRASGIVQVLNWNKAQVYPDNVPGLCTGNNDVPRNIAVEACAYLQLNAGMHRFHIVTDDRAGIYKTLNPTDTILPLWESAGSTANTMFDFLVEADGLYPIRILWEETGGSARLSLYSVDVNDGTEILVNDPNNPAAVKAWYPVVCKYAAAASGPYTVASGVSNVLNTSDIQNTGCGLTGTASSSGTLTIPMSGTTRFYRLDGPRPSVMTRVTRDGSNLVVDYQYR